MPVCTNCAAPSTHLYTTYRTASNIRLTVCPRCNTFADPLIEHPPLILLLDLILLKPRVFLHLLFNRGSRPLEAAQPQDSAATRRQGDEHAERQRRLWGNVLWLGSIVVLAETILTVLPTFRSRPEDGRDSLTRRELEMVLVAGSGVLAEIVVQHLTTVGLTLVCLWARGWYPPRGKESSDGRRQHIQPVLVSLTLLYTAILPLLLQLFLSIWYHPSSHHESLPLSSPPTLLVPKLIDTLHSTFEESNTSGTWLKILLDALGGLADVESGLVELWYSADRVWIGTRLLGGMSAGFGLRVLLPTTPGETTGVVLAGWALGDLVRRNLGLERYIAG